MEGSKIRLRVVSVPGTKLAIQPAPGFLKKGLADYHLELMGRCGFACSYCSSETGNYLRINGGVFAEAGEEQTGVLRRHTQDPADEHTVYAWPKALETLETQVAGKPRTWGAGKTLVVSMLTDAFSLPGIERHGGAASLTERALRLVLAKTSFRIRILTKSAAVGTAKWVRFFADHRERFTVGLSIGTLDDAWAAKIERGTSPPSRRVRALRNLQDAGVPTFGMLCPVFPDVLNDNAVNTLERLLDAISPDQCDDIWYEPYNDRSNWRKVQAGYEPCTVPWINLSLLFGPEPSLLRQKRRSAHHVELYERVRATGERGGWFDKTHYLLYEGDIVPEHVPRLLDLRGVLLQGKTDADGFSRNQAIAAVQKNAMQRRGAK